MWWCIPPPTRSQLSRLGLCTGSWGEPGLRRESPLHRKGPRAVAARSWLRRGAILQPADFKSAASTFPPCPCLTAMGAVALRYGSHIWTASGGSQPITGEVLGSAEATAQEEAGMVLVFKASPPLAVSEPGWPGVVGAGQLQADALPLQHHIAADRHSSATG
jgi:hypothetical protein